MNTKIESVNRGMLNEERIAICSHFGCGTIKKVKPLKFGSFGFRKYPKCSKHKLSLVFVDEFVEQFICSVNACLFDLSSLPPKDLVNSITEDVPEELELFINVWMYCSPIGRGAQIISRYFDGLSKGYIKLLSRKQRKAIQCGKSSKRSYNMLRQGLKKIADEYTLFLQELRAVSHDYCDLNKVLPLSKKSCDIIKTWRKKQSVNRRKKSTKDENLNNISLLKNDYDDILHLRTSSFIIGKPPTEKISAFELFSAYFEFLKEGLCSKLKKENIQQVLNIQETNTENSSSKSHLRQELLTNLYGIIDLINLYNSDQKDVMKSKSKEILEEFISRIEQKEFYLPKNANLRVIASTLVYTTALYVKKLPILTTRKIGNIADATPSNISRYYRRYFEKLYPRKNFEIYGFKRIKLIISLYFFELLKNSKLRTSELISNLEKEIYSEFFKEEFGEYFTKDIEILRNMVTQYRDKFIKYFSDLAEIVKLLANTSKIHKEIGAKVYLKPIIDLLNEENFNLFQKSRFVFSVREIYDSLRHKNPDLFPPRAYQTKDRNVTNKQRTKTDKDLIRIIGSRLKIYAIKNIYKGKYFKNGQGKCQECQEEKMIINTDISRLNALEFHHTSEKENHFTANRLYELFTKNLRNLNLLEWLIELMEAEEVVLICRNHHRILEEKYYGYFHYLINWKNLFRYPPEVIHALIRISVDTFYKTKLLSVNKKAGIRDAIARYMKKRYIIEFFYGGSCHTCGEFHTNNHLPAFVYHHKNEESKTVNISKVYHLTCSEIIQIIIKEQGGYVCSNCHRLIHYNKFIPLLDDIYKDKNMIKRITNDYNRILRAFAPIEGVDIRMKGPLIKPTLDTDSFMKFLIAIYEISKMGKEVNNTELKEYLSYHDVSSITGFFRRKADIIGNYISVIKGVSKSSPTKYKLNEKGKNVISLFYKFMDFYAISSN